ncbi:hypothetical protein RvVAT039_15560 [Agrobacterium vitis]|uniref:hypothetical protein n=1 Tax=Agrobacterium vitis TaxID=373 RepID=UPI0015DA8439|nr:hypothetical protein [Agrobacterium vitis]BCH64340.1 hypothetical protein RvVAT039_15560 [Agrobacterium vitis]
MVEKLQSEARNKVFKGAVDTACVGIHTTGMLSGHTGSWGDNEILEQARIATMRPGGRAEAYLNHYRQGSGADIHFSVKQLMDEDQSVKAHITRKINEMVAFFENSGTPMSSMIGIVGLAQKYFSNIDWQYATGSLNIKWSVVDKFERPNGRFLLVELSCVNVYRWHPEADRYTQCVHQAAQNLQKPASDFNVSAPLNPMDIGSYVGLKPGKTQKFPAARNFKMISKPERVILPKLSGIPNVSGSGAVSSV